MRNQNYSEFSSVCESFVADVDSNVSITGINTIMQNAELVADNSKTFIANDISNMKCNIENDQLCRQIKSDLDNLSDIRASALNAYQNISDKYAKCKQTAADCNKNKRDRQVVESELNYLNTERAKIQSVIQACDSFEAEIARLTPQINTLQNEINTSLATINSITIDNQRCSNNNITNIINDKRAALNRAKIAVSAAERLPIFKWIKRKIVAKAAQYRDSFVHSVQAGDRCLDAKNRYQNASSQINNLRNTLNSIINQRKNNCVNDRYTKYNRFNADHTSTQIKFNNLQNFDRINCKVVENCETEYKPLVDAKYAEFNTSTEQHGLKQTEYNTCKDPTKNQCKSFYNNINQAEQDLAKNVNAIRTGITMGEGMCANIDQCTDQVKQDYSDLEQSRTKIQNALAEINKKPMVQRRIDETYSYTESTIYTNIILTTASISLLYYLFTRIK